MFYKESSIGYREVLPAIGHKTLVYGERTLLTEFRMCQGGTLPRHAHPHEQTGYLIKGRILLTIGNETFDARPGDSWSIPSQIEHVLMDMPEVGEYFQVVLERVNHLDEMTVRVEMSDKAFSGELGDLQKVTGAVARKLKDALNLRTKVVLVDKGSLPRVEGKSKKVIDLRSSI